MFSFYCFLTISWLDISQIFMLLKTAWFFSPLCCYFILLYLHKTRLCSISNIIFTVNQTETVTLLLKSFPALLTFCLILLVLSTPVFGPEYLNWHFFFCQIRLWTNRNIMRATVAVWHSGFLQSFPYQQNINLQAVRKGWNI